MFHKENPEYNRRQVGFYTLDELVPKDHFLRKVEETIDFSFIYDLVEDSYSSDNGFLAYLWTIRCLILQLTVRTIADALKTRKC